MGVALHTYGADSGDFPNAYPDVHKPTTAGLFSQFNHGGATGRAWMLPKMVQSGYIDTPQVGFCPNTWALDFTYVAGPPPAPAGLTHQKFVGQNPQKWKGSIDFQLSYAGAGGAHRGEYLYTGPWAHTWVWQRRYVSGRMLSDVLGISGSNWWVFGVHLDGFVGDPSNPYNRSNNFSNRSRLPIMGEGGEDLPGRNVTATHFSQIKDYDDFGTSGGIQNYLFTDGSAASFQYSN